jgi:hypothetical protein
VDSGNKTDPVSWYKRAACASSSSSFIGVLP